MQQAPHKLWINEKEKIISFHKEENYEIKTFKSQDNYTQFILIHGRCGYKFK